MSRYRQSCLSKSRSLLLRASLYVIVLTANISDYVYGPLRGRELWSLDAWDFIYGPLCVRDL